MTSRISWLGSNRVAVSVQSVLVVGAGSRGLGVYANYAQLHPEQFQVVAVAEPRQHYREEMARSHGLAGDRTFHDWREVLQHPRLAQAVILATPDQEHVEPALALMQRGYDLLLEKPMDTTLAGCQRLVQVSREEQRLLVVAHVLRYTPYFRQLKELASSGLIGQLASVRHLEPVHYWHQAHSFVRGNWRNLEQSAPMILAKSCHDLDMLCHLVAENPVAVASFGSLTHFRPENRPPGGSDRCLECRYVDHGCAYSAKRIYLGMLDRGNTGWPVDVLTPDTTPAGVLLALKDGPYGRCVYACDNNVVDHQVVALEFASGVSATFTMTAFTEHRLRETELLGSQGQLLGDGWRIRYTPFGDVDPALVSEAQLQPNGDYLWDFSQVPSSGHSGGDDGLMAFFHECLCDREKALSWPLPEEALRGHALCFAAEQARLERRLVELQL